jgi:hypothetical protein
VDPQAERLTAADGQVESSKNHDRAVPLHEVVGDDDGFGLASIGERLRGGGRP